MDKLQAIQSSFDSLIPSPARYATFKDFLSRKGNRFDNAVLDIISVATYFNEQTRYDDLISYYKHQESIYAAIKSPVFWAWFYFVQCDQLQKVKHYDEAYSCSELYYKYLKQDPNGQCYRNASWVFSKAIMDYRYCDYTQSIALAKRSLQLNDPHIADNSQYYIFAHDLIGTCYLKTFQYDSARVWFQKTYDFSNLEELRSLIWRGISSGKMGSAWFGAGDYTKATPYLLKGMEICQQTATWDNYIPFACRMSKIYMEYGQTAKAAELLQQVQKAVLVENHKSIETNVHLHFLHQENMLLYYSTCVDYYRLTGNAMKALLYADSAGYAREFISKAFDARRKTAIDASMAIQQKEIEAQNAHEKASLWKWLAVLLAIIMILAGTAGYLLVKRQQIRNQLSKEIMELEKQKAQQELESAREQIQHYAENLREKNIMADTFEAELEKIKLGGGNIPSSNYAVIEQLRTSTILTEDEWNVFRNTFNAAYPGYLQKLRDTYPDLTIGEVRYMLLVKLNFTPKEMMSILGVGAEAVRSLRFRVKKKLNVADDFNLEELEKV